MTQELKRFDIILIDFGENTIDSEQSGVRLGVIIQNDIGNHFSPTTIVMPLTSKIHKNPNQPTHTLIRKNKDNGLQKDSMVLGEMMRVVSEKRILKYIGTISDKETKKEIKRVYDANFGE